MDLVNHLSDRLLFAVPKKGRLHAASLDLLAGSDIQFRRETRLDIALVKNLPIALIFLPAADIPTFVGEGRVDLGITGRDQVHEHDSHLPLGEESGVEEVMDLGFGKCSLQVQVPGKGAIKDPKQLVGMNIVTSFTGLTEQYFARLEGMSGKREYQWNCHAAKATNVDQVCRRQRGSGVRLGSCAWNCRSGGIG